MKKKFAFLLLLLVVVGEVFSQTSIKLNQIGFYPGSKKVAVVPSSEATSFSVTSEDGSATYFTGILSGPDTWSYSQESVQLADLSSFTTAGSFKIVVDGVGESHVFDIKNNVLEPIVKGSIKAYYFNRASTALLPEYADDFGRNAGHPDSIVYVHSSAATLERPAGTVISCPKGWYDAGDYNKYIVNSGISTYTLLASYEHSPEYFNTIDLNIPESGDEIPDILNEVLWNLEWMLTMQDLDGGVYHKCTSRNFSGAVMPEDDVADRFVVQKGTAATLDFAAVMAVAARVFADFEEQKPGFSQQCLQAAIDAWNWARANPSVSYRQPRDISTGSYGDRNFNDEFDWAAAELYITTGNDTYYSATNLISSACTLPTWGDVAGLAWMSLAFHIDNLTATADTSIIRSKILSFADGLYDTYDTSAYKVAMGNGSWNFTWGSNSFAANQGMMLMQAYNLTDDNKYLDAAIANLDYLMGRNATGYSFITGFGDQTPMFPHHRPSEADTVTEPVPGWLVGGPHSGQQDQCEYPSSIAALSYSDTWCSYATNEVTINWNAPLVYLAGTVQGALGTYAPDCAGVSGGDFAYDQCGRCLLPSDPLYNSECSVTGFANSYSGKAVIAPNPTSAGFTIDLSGVSGKVEYIISDMRGSEIVSGKSQGGQKIYIDEDLVQGVYLIKVKIGEELRTFSLVKI